MVPVLLMIVATAIGWGLVIDTTGAGKGLSWLGFLLGPLGLGGRDGGWAYANLGVPVALLVGFAGYVLLRTNAVRRQESSRGHSLDHAVPQAGSATNTGISRSVFVWYDA